MVQFGRVACIFTPFVLSIGSLVLIVLIFLAGTQSPNSMLGGLYFFKADTTDFSAATGSDASSILAQYGVNASAALVSALSQAKADLNLKDYYTIYLWNYCAWDGNYEGAHCSPRQAEFWFNPVEVWGLNGTGVDDYFPKELRDELKTYQTVSKWMFIVYAAAFATTALEILVGFSAIFSRWGSFITTFFSTLSSLFILIASITATVLFSVLTGGLNKGLKPYGIKGNLGMSILRITWIAVAFSFGAGLFWLFSVCCCSGRSPYGNRNSKRVKVEKTPYTYERVGSPYLGPQQPPPQDYTFYGGQNVPMTNMGPKEGAYEPYRNQQV